MVRWYGGTRATYGAVVLDMRHRPRRSGFVGRFPLSNSRTIVSGKVPRNMSNTELDRHKGTSMLV